MAVARAPGRAGRALPASAFVRLSHLGATSSPHLDRSLGGLCRPALGNSPPISGVCRTLPMVCTCTQTGTRDDSSLRATSACDDASPAVGARPRPQPSRACPVCSPCFGLVLVECSRGDAPSAGFPSIQRSPRRLPRRPRSSAHIHPSGSTPCPKLVY
ncbi:hypothetical protein CERSUDRAFT_109799 [Gelatoporia subvermispora B]|uniref:Uncharacterized protein n=1 Tax=Ceriporiopsis subvermispora (strain B) TaxID=914234 RepID=M2P5F1_CERS8|nr:hypothetical protein CERSUDRAFT_109799 [Gelatoporia subvermispora B]